MEMSAPDPAMAAPGLRRSTFGVLHHGVAGAGGTGLLWPRGGTGLWPKRPRGGTGLWPKTKPAPRGNWPVAKDEAGLEGEMAAETPMMTLTMNERLTLAAAAAPVVAAVAVAEVVA